MDKPERIPGTHPRRPAFGPRQPKKNRNPFYGTTRWLKLSKLVRKEQLFCALCREPSTHVDHLDGCTDNNKRHNLLGLCDSCHSWKTNAFDKQPNGKLKYIYSLFQFERFAVRYADRMPDGLLYNEANTACRALCELENLAVAVWDCHYNKSLASQFNKLVAECNKQDILPYTVLQYAILRAAYQTRGTT